MTKKEPLYPHVPKSRKGEPVIHPRTENEGESEVTNEMLSATNAKIHIINAINELDLAGRMLPSGGRTGKVLDLFSGTDNRLNHIKEDLEDISEGRPFRHE